MLRSPQAGDSPLTVVFGVAIFLGFLLFAAQVLLHLYATSTVTAIAFDTARRAAAAGPTGEQQDHCGGQQARARAALGSWGRGATIDCDARDGVFVTVTIAGPSPAAALRIYEDVFDVTTIERSASVRREGIAP